MIGNCSERAKSIYKKGKRKEDKNEIILLICEQELITDHYFSNFYTFGKIFNKNLNRIAIMNRFLIVSLLFLTSLFASGQHLNEKSIQQTLEARISLPDTLKSFYVKKNPPYVFTANLNHKERSLGNKIGRGTLYSMGYDAVILTNLILSPTWFTQWNDTTTFFTKFKNAYTKPPVIDHDLFITNYLGHPYQGGFYYNSIRSQGASVLESSLFCFGQSLLWEYGWEAGFEQPSIQDLITTPLGGILYGELTHYATIAMSKHGFKWYEIAAVIVFNPAYAINNGFRFNKPLKVR